MTKEIISSHIFVFPFRWDVVKDEACLEKCIDSRLDVEKFIECLNVEGNWEEDEGALKIVRDKKVENDKEYNKYAYFYDNARKAIYGKDNFGRKISSSIVRCLNHKNIAGNSIYKIHVEKRNNKGDVIFNKIYELEIESIKLKIYDTGVATLSYFLENNEYRNKEDILRINDYGRRIYPQYMPLDNVKSSFLAKKLSVEIQNRTIEEDFDYGVKEKPTKISKTIMGILGEKFISVEKELECKYRWLNKKESVVVKPVIDDRMFVICYYSDNTCSRVLTNFNKDEYLKNDFWYQFLFVDNGGATCKDEKMTKELLSKSTYTRWKDYGTLFGISRYSFVLICNEGKPFKDILFNHTNTIYYEMILLALVQRASILRFSDETSRIASVESKNIYEQIKKLQEYYIRFVNTIYFREVTAQEQGIELYDKLTEFMRIEREVKRLDEEIDEIQRYVTLEANDRTNKLIERLTYMGIIISVIGVVATSYELNFKVLYWMGGFTLVTIICILIFKRMQNRR
ncbi:hypothetical protein [Clostridium sporogenes]|uniref:hypothetical protein n=1 Tax=Clostridium sporogenes TaxID=1509 RepID=UPI001FAC8CF6|nr:hypothetical protein [Clostridium sporogenes]